MLYQVIWRVVNQTEPTMWLRLWCFFPPKYVHPLHSRTKHYSDSRLLWSSACRVYVVRILHLISAFAINFCFYSSDLLVRSLFSPLDPLSANEIIFTYETDPYEVLFVCNVILQRNIIIINREWSYQKFS